MAKKEKNGYVYDKKGYYYIRITYYVGDVRKLKDISTGIRVGNPESRTGKKARREADVKLVEALQSFELPKIQQKTPRDQMFATVVKEWFERQYSARAPSTIAGYQYCVNDIVTYFSEVNPVQLANLESWDIEDYQKWERMRRQPSYTGKYARQYKYRSGCGIENTIKHRTTLIRSVLEDMKRRGYVTRNVASTRDCKVELPKPMAHVFSVLSPEEANRFVECLKGEELWFIVAVLLALTLALRRSEVCGLREGDINWETGVLTVCHTVTQQTINGKNVLTSKPFTKNRKPKCLNVEKRLQKVIRALIQEHETNTKLFGESYHHEWDGYLIRYPDGQLVSPNRITEHFKRFLKKKRLKEMRFHDLRHSCATILLAMGYDIKTVQGIMGHADLSSTMVYLHFLEKQKKEALSGICNAMLGKDEDTDEENENWWKN